MPVTQELWRLSQDDHELEVGLDYIARSFLKIRKIKNSKYKRRQDILGKKIQRIGNVGNIRDMVYNKSSKDPSRFLRYPKVWGKTLECYFRYQLQRHQLRREDIGSGGIP